MQKCANAYPALASFIHPDNLNARFDLEMKRLYDHALMLARGVLTDEMVELQRGTHDTNSAAYCQKKDHILVKLRRLTPGQCSAVQNPSADVSTEPAIMAAAPQTHWSKVFKCKPIDGEVLTDWLTSVLGVTRTAVISDLSQATAEAKPTTRSH